jgi:GH25 family lysozyme M1 (1,4-beta-N-acetylmuramidase)
MQNRAPQTYASCGRREKTMNQIAMSKFRVGIVSALLGIVLLTPHAAQAARPYGIDVSHWDGTGINWVTVKNSGYTFAWAKASEGTWFTDDTFVVNAVNAKAAGVLIGAYHFADYNNNLGTAGAQAEANYFWNVAKNYIKGGGYYLMPMLDVEYAPSGYTKTTLSQWVNAWCSRVVSLAAASGVTVKPVIYTGVSFANSWFDTTVTNWIPWIANWNGLDPQTGGPSGTSPWPTWKVWQYSATGAVPGVPATNCDKDVFNGTAADLVSTLVIGGSANNPPSITQQPVNQNVLPGGTAYFLVGATGDGTLSYRWQKNNTNLNNAGHYSGVLTTMLTVSNCDSNDVAGYRCVVTNAYGSTNSSAAALTLATNTGGATLTAIPSLGADTSNEGRAITSDGKYVVGLSGTTAGFFYNVANTSVVQVAGSDAVAADLLTGVGYRTDTSQVPAQSQLLVSGIADGNYAVWMTTNGGVTWSSTYQLAVVKKTAVPLANGLGGNPLSDVFSAVWTDQGTGGSDNWGLYNGQGSGPWVATFGWDNKTVNRPTSWLQMNGVSSNGRAVGWRQNSGGYINYISDYVPATSGANWSNTGLDGTTAGLLYSVSADGTSVFGISPKAGTGATNSPYKATFNSTFPGQATQLSTGELPSFVNTTGFTYSTAADNTNVAITVAIPFGCTADGRYAVGLSYRGSEKAVLWDTGDASPVNWTVTDLTEYATSKGILGSFTRLARAYSVGKNAAGNLVITGIGDYNSGGTKTRAFVLTLSSTPAPRPQITSVVGAGTTSVTVTWTNTVAGTNYVLQYNTNLNATNWYDLSPVTASGSTASKTDNPPAGGLQRYYRVRVQ